VPDTLTHLTHILQREKRKKKERKRNTSSGKRGIIQEMDRETIRLSNRNCLLFQKSEEEEKKQFYEFSNK
jgi:hypothetical protein